MMRGLPRRAYTLDFKQDAVRQALTQGLCATARELGLPEQTLRNWIRAGREGRLAAPAADAVDVTPDHMEQTRAHAEAARQHRRQLLREGASASPNLPGHLPTPGPLPAPRRPEQRPQALHSPMLPLPRLHRH